MGRQTSQHRALLNRVLLENTSSERGCPPSLVPLVGPAARDRHFEWWLAHMLWHQYPVPWPSPAGKSEAMPCSSGVDGLRPLS